MSHLPGWLTWKSQNSCSKDHIRYHSQNKPCTHLQRTRMEETLGERWKKRRLATMSRFINNQTPSYLRQPLPMNNNAYVLRNIIYLLNSATQATTMQFVFYPKTIYGWKNLDQSINNSPSLETFKGKLKDTKHPPPDWFYSNDGIYSIFHSRLRMSCSPFNDDLFSQIHVIESPQCLCGHIQETVSHFLLGCPLFTSEQTIMLNELLKFTKN